MNFNFLLNISVIISVAVAAGCRPTNSQVQSIVSKTHFIADENTALFFKLDNPDLKCDIPQGSHIYLEREAQFLDLLPLDADSKETSKSVVYAQVTLAFNSPICAGKTGFLAMPAFADEATVRRAQAGNYGLVTTTASGSTSGNRVEVERTGIKNSNGLEELLVTRYVGNKPVDSLIGYSGYAGQQNQFANGKGTKQGSNAPLPGNTAYSLTVEKAATSTRERYYGDAYVRLNPLNSINRTGLLAHHDNGTPGSAGCLVFPKGQNYKAFMNWFGDSNKPTKMYTDDWSKGASQQAKAVASNMTPNYPGNVQQTIAQVNYPKEPSSLLAQKAPVRQQVPSNYRQVPQDPWANYYASNYPQQSYGVPYYAYDPYYSNGYGYGLGSEESSNAEPK